MASGNCWRHPHNLGNLAGSMRTMGETRRRHKGDFMSTEVRSRVMSRIRGKDTGPERTMAAAFEELGLRAERHARDLPGCPDFVLRKACVAIFVDGDFWHGWRFSQWRDKLSPKWELKIQMNRSRDARAHRRLRRRGWKVIRLWEHQVERDAISCAMRVLNAIAAPTHGS